MAVQHSFPRPDLEAHRESIQLSFPDIVQSLTETLGRKLTAYIASASDTRTVDRWMGGTEPYRDAESRLRLAYQVTKMLSSYAESKRVVQAWMMGLNPELNDRVPARLLREDSLEIAGPAVLAAARAFLAGG